MLTDGSPALLFEDVQPADDYGTELNCPIYGYGFSHDGVPFSRPISSWTRRLPTRPSAPR